MSGGRTYTMASWESKMSEEDGTAVRRASLTKKQKVLLLMAMMWIVGWMMGFGMATALEACEGVCV
jgi:hypothetical protein